MTSRLFSVAIVLAITACSSTASPTLVCTNDARAGLLVTVVDATTGLPLTAPSVVTIRDGAYVETVSDGINSHYALAYEHAGNYRITVTSSGYATWEQASAVVKANACHVETTSVTAALHR